MLTFFQAKKQLEAMAWKSHPHTSTCLTVDAWDDRTEFSFYVQYGPRFEANTLEGLVALVKDKLAPDHTNTDCVDIEGLA